MNKIFYTFFILMLACVTSNAQKLKKTNYEVIAYFSTDSAAAQQYDYSKITQVIYSFGHTDSLGNFTANRSKDSAALNSFKNIKAKYPQLKILISMGGWGGCRFCSDVFASEAYTKQFAATTKKYLDDFNLDGIDLDWEYPAVENYPEHKYQPADKQNFTRLVKLLRASLGKNKILSFAAGGFKKYLTDAVEWHKIQPYVDYVNLMSYDLVGGYATVTGHHTPLYSAKENEESVNRAIQYFKSIGFPLNKVIVGAAFYTRSWGEVENINNGLYQSGKFISMTDYKVDVERLQEKNGFKYFWSDKNKAPYWYNANEKIFATGDNKRSVKEKCAYVKKYKLGGIMFWELPLDKPQDGLLDAINLNN